MAITNFQGQCLKSSLYISLSTVAIDFHCRSQTAKREKKKKCKKIVGTASELHKQEANACKKKNTNI